MVGLDFQMAGRPTCKKYVSVVIINTEFLCGIPSNVPNTESYYTSPALLENKKKHLMNDGQRHYIMVNLNLEKNTGNGGMVWYSWSKPSTGDLL